MGPRSRRQASGGKKKIQPNREPYLASRICISAWFWAPSPSGGHLATPLVQLVGPLDTTKRCARFWADQIGLAGVLYGRRLTRRVRAMNGLERRELRQIPLAKKF